ncbi:hypothetical protein [Myxococcus stipitatus]|uniref:hypothetical protein n=1 Tax=Myxococcus stipitatus TaxID=83455 RepID=UPI0030D6012F
MNALFRKDLWLLGVVCTPAIAMAAGLLYPSHMLHYVPYDPYDPYGPVPSTVPTEDVTAGGTYVRQVGEHAYEVITVKGNTKQASPCIPPEVRIAPAFAQGKPQGVKLFAIKPGSIYQRLGFLDGDIIQRVNGRLIDSAETALEVYVALKNVRHFEVDLLRGGVPVRKVYDLK